MARATCRCGQPLTIDDEATDRVVCPKCGARVRIRREPEDRTVIPPADNFIRFFCPCGRRLKVDALKPPSHGKCPDCGRVVPVPDIAPAGPAHPETPTADIPAADQAALDRWIRDHQARSSASEETPSTTELAGRPAAPAVVRAEVGLRVCPRCGKPVHLGSDTCRQCGTPVPRR